MQRPSYSNPRRLCVSGLAHHELHAAFHADSLEPQRGPMRNLKLLMFPRLFIPMILGSVALAQSAFEVAELKVNRSGPGESRGDLSNGRLTVTNFPLRYLIAEAWSVQPSDIEGPAFLDDVRLDVIAKTSSPTTPDQEVRLMVQTLLKDRMKLIAHVEERVKPVWALTVWKGQAKLTRSTMPQKPEDSDCTFQNGSGRARLACRHMTMPSFVHELPHFANSYIDKAIVDQTGLSGAWEFKAEWTPFPQLDSDGGLTLFAALQSQLGLQLENKKLPIPVVVVDSIEKNPAE
jgi:uncharacterized protein (TIGR03435 family)